MTMRYDRCTCCGKTFAEINAIARQLNTTSIKRLRCVLHMGNYCSACRPYLVEMFKTGQTNFEVEHPTD